MSIHSLVRRPIEKLSPSATCAAAAALMRDQRVGAVVVADGEALLGIVTDRDLVLRVVAEGLDPKSVTLHEVMTRNPVYLPSSCSVEAALRTMRELGVRRIPVTHGTKIEGMLSLDDVLASLGRQLSEAADVVSEALAPPRAN